MGKPEAPNRAWYLVFTKPKKEYVAQENLARQGYHVYLPLLASQQSRRGRYCSIIEPMFPRYLFIHLDAIWDNWAPIRSTGGVANLVRFGDTPAKVPDELVHFLQSRGAEKDSVQHKQEKCLTAGERVQAIDGPMAGYEGIFESELPNERVVVLYDIVGKHTRVTMPRQAVQLAKA